MIYSALTTPQIIYIIVVSAIVVIAILIIMLFPVRKFQIRKHFTQHYYREIAKIAKYNDYYLINNFTFKVDSTTYLTVNHMLFADKYVYLIMDFYYDGDIAGKAFDKSLIFMSNKGKKQYIDNPILICKNVLTKLSMATGIQPSIMIGVALINDNCISNIETDSNQFYAISRKKLSALIKAVESRPIGNLNAKSLEKLVLSLDKTNRKNKKNERTKK